MTQGMIRARVQPLKLPGQKQKPTPKVRWIKICYDMLWLRWRWWWWCCVDDWWFSGDVTVVVSIGCTRDHQEPYEIPISLFVDFDISRAWRLLKAMLVWSGASCGELSELKLSEKNTQRALRWNNGIATLLGFSIFFCCLGQEDCKYFPFTIRIDDVRSDPLIPLHPGDGSGALGGCWWTMMGMNIYMRTSI